MRITGSDESLNGQGVYSEHEKAAVGNCDGGGEYSHFYCV